MDKKNKGLADNQDGDIILNESGTSVNFGWDEKESETQDENEALKDDPKVSGNTSADSETKQPTQE